ncbi:MAG: signal peptidase I, partial [Thermoplasmataceae archaeon]
MKVRWYLPVLYIAIWQLSFYFKISSWYILIGTMPLVLFYYQKFMGDRRWKLSPVFFAIFAFLLIMPAVLSHTISAHIYPSIFINSAVYSFIFSFTLIPVVFSTIVDMSNRKLFNGMILSGLAYFLVITPVFEPYTGLQIVRLLLYQFSFDLTFSMYVSFLYLSGGKKSLGPFLFFALYSTFSFMGFTEKVSPLFNIVWEIISISILFWLTYFVMGENYWVKKLLKTKHRIRIRTRRKKSDIAFAAVMAVIAVGAIGSYYTHTIAADPTPSMYPVIVPGSLLIIEPEHPQSIKLGDIIEFHAPWANGTLYAHKVVDIEKVNGQIYFKTRGVNNPVDDPGMVPGS